jgi:molybdopterin-guanine dinucleotide biosynthesis protein A
MQKLFGLVICGGQSSRMETDKSLLEYYKMPQRYYLYNMLEPLCNEVFLSCNPNQTSEISEFYNFVVDKSDYDNIGPMAALLSAYLKYPDVSFLVVGCDYPFIDEKALKKLMENRSDGLEAVCYFNPKTNFEEPLLAIYENACMPKILQNFEEGNYSLRHFLKAINSKKINSETLESLISVDTMGQYQEALLKLKESSKN